MPENVIDYGLYEPTHGEILYTLQIGERFHKRIQNEAKSVKSNPYVCTKGFGDTVKFYHLFPKARMHELMLDKIRRTLEISPARISKIDQALDTITKIVGYHPHFCVYSAKGFYKFITEEAKATPSKWLIDMQPKKRQLISIVPS